ncbi:acyltransferase [Sphingomonas sp.]|uniref:acyltransferase family protein n=1 Tax=Sphingomonas sp. TaxID=28214 RepID=UPI00286CAB71|nr:acyltransferase [Sphingomonas sp.]
MQRVGSLDGLRGLAAIIVLLHHAAIQVGGFSLFASGYLAVDFFFMLSGYVVARAYERKLAGDLTPAGFMTLRIKRLYPVMAIGIIAGAAVALASGAAGGAVAWRLAAQLAFVPIIAGSAGLFILNGVQWSLFFELVANVVHALWLRRLSGRAMIAMVIGGLAVLAWTASRFQWFGLGDRGDNFVGGFPRVMFSYCVGVAMVRLGPALERWRPAMSGALLLVALPVVLMLADVAKGTMPDWQVDLAVVALVLPIVLHLGIGATIEPGLERWSAVMGSMSYPLYAAHLPALGLVILLAPGFGFGAFVAACMLALGCAYGLALWLEPGARTVRVERSNAVAA